MSPNNLRHLQQKLTNLKLSGLVVTKRENLTYLTGINQLDPHNREAILLVSPKLALLYHSPFLSPPNYPWLKTLAMSRANPIESVYSQFFQPSSRLALEAHSMTVAEKNKLKISLPTARLVDTQNLIEDFRLIKSPEEVKLMAQAARITQKLMLSIISLINRLTDKPMSELSLSHLIESTAYELGADGMAFPPVVAFGKNSALPHHQPTGKKLTPNTVVLLDLGVTVKGYASDMTRTIFLGTPPPHFLKIEKIVKSAHQAALSLLSQHFAVTLLTNPTENSKIKHSRSGILTASSVDFAARSVIEAAGYGKQFIHTTGHGLGLEIHEAPSINSSNQYVLKSGMAITIEPGIYLPGKFGYRHEDTLYLT
jgi:Xaa-Pro aminopeptidase